jgi:two-component system alkaline phosphatase synthesis response regulator PhoP
MQGEKELSRIGTMNESLSSISAIRDDSSKRYQTPVVDAADIAVGDYCNTTHRIVIISPFPYSLHKLVKELTAKCYDVLVFRHSDDETLAVLPIDLMIMDLSKETKEIKAAPGAALSVRNQPIPVLQLVSAELLARLEPQPGAVAMDWETSTIEQVLEQIHAMLQQGGERPGGTVVQRSELLQLKDLTLDHKRVAVFVGGSRIEVTKTEFDLLKALLEAGGSALSRQELMDRVWGDQYFGGSNTVDVHVKSLRHKLGDDPKAPKYIATIRGVGYRTAD